MIRLPLSSSTRRAAGAIAALAIGAVALVAPSSGGVALAAGAHAKAKPASHKPKHSGAKAKKGEKKPEKAAPKKHGKHAGAAAPAAHATHSAANATTAPAADEAPVTVSLAIERVTLDNGLRVVLAPDKTSPTVAVSVTYDVGSRGEQRGRSGFAHLFEHMMFQGSKNVPKGEHFTLVSGHGGVLNGTTSSDRTNYYEVLPSNELALALWLEADRMKSLDVSEANFDNQRKVVEEEYRMRISNAPYVPSELKLESLVYQGYWPYEHPTIGSMDDLDAAKLDWVQDFHAHHYAPNDTVLTIAGDFDKDQAMSMVHQYFDAAQKVDVAKFQDASLPEQTAQRTAVVKDDNVRTPGVLYGWAIPPYRSADHYALELAAAILGDGESSRLYQQLVRDKAMVQDVSVGTDDRRGPDMFTVDAKLADGAKVGEVEKLIEGDLKNFAPTDAEMTKAKRRVQAAFVFGLQSNLSRAIKLGEFETFFGDARQINAELPKYLAVTKDDVKRVVAQYLSPTRRTIVETYPATEPAAPAKAPAAPAAEKSAHAATTPSAGKAAKHGAAAGKKKTGAAAPAKPTKKKK